MPTHAVAGAALKACSQALARLSCLAAEAYALATMLWGELPSPNGAALGRRPWPGSHRRVAVIVRAGPGGGAKVCSRRAASVAVNGRPITTPCGYTYTWDCKQRATLTNMQEHGDNHPSYGCPAVSPAGLSHTCQRSAVHSLGSTPEAGATSNASTRP